MTSLLERFGIEFESDASDVESGLHAAENAANQLGDSVSDVDNATQDLGGSFLEMMNSAQGALAALVGAGAITAGIINAAQMTEEIGRFSETLGVNIEDVHAWSSAVERFGGAGEDFRESLRDINEGLVDIVENESGPFKEVFDILGISALDSSGKVKTSTEALLDLADAFEGISPAKAAGLGQILAFDQGTILLLQQGRQAVEQIIARQKELGVVTQEDYEITKRFNEQWHDVQQQFNAIFATAGTTILPALTYILEGVEAVVSFLADNQTLVEGFFIGIAGVITYVYGPAIASAAAATIAAASPFLLIGAIIAGVGAAFALAYDDVVNFLEGNKSVIGEISKEYPIVGDIVRGMADVIKFHLNTLKAIFKFVLRLFTEPKKAIQDLKALMKEFFDFVAENMPDFAAIAQSAKNAVGLGGPDQPSAIREAFQTLDQNSLGPVTEGAIVYQGRVVERTTSVSVGEVNVNTQATDAKGIAAGASDALSSEMQKVVSDYDDGIDR